MADIDSSLPVVDDVSGPGQNRAISVGTSAVEALGGPTVQADRRFISIQPTNGIVYWGMTSGVTTSNGMAVYPGQTATFAFASDCPLYLIASSTVNVRVAEG